MLQAIGRAFGLMVGFFFWGLILLMVAALVLGSLWLDASGVEQQALVAAKYERITFTHADWTRTLEIGLQREVSPMAGPADLVERVRVAAADYDGLRTGQTVAVRVQPPGFFKEWRIFSQVRLAGHTTYSILRATYESAWPLPQFLVSMMPAALLGWLASRSAKGLSQNNWFN